MIILVINNYYWDTNLESILSLKIKIFLIVFSRIAKRQSSNNIKKLYHNFEIIVYRFSSFFGVFIEFLPISLLQSLVAFTTFLGSMLGGQNVTNCC